MRLPQGDLDDLARIFLRKADYSILGCLSAEERCCAVPVRLNSDKCRSVTLLEIMDPKDAFPDYSAEIDRRIQENCGQLTRKSIKFKRHSAELLSTEDDLLDMLGDQALNTKSEVVVLDITSMPKRFFCFFLKRLMLSDSLPNLIVTYSQPKSNGHTSGHLSEDPMTCESLPGYAAEFPPSASTLVLSLGFEALGIRSLLEMYQQKKNGTKAILPFPGAGHSAKRTWHTLMEITEGDYEAINRKNLEVVSSTDAEYVYELLGIWNEDSDGLALASFGPKPHSLGMALFAIKHDYGMYYTQPKVYNPEYSIGVGRTVAYVVKWRDVACYDRRVRRT